MSAGEQDHNSRSEQIRQVIGNCRQTLAGGGDFSDQAVLDQFPTLLPELVSELKKLRLVDNARRRAEQASRDAPTEAASAATPAVSGEIRDSPDADLTAPHIFPSGSPQPSPPADRGPTTIRYFGDYELLSEVARGGMGVVYRARQVSLNRIVAVKMILAGCVASESDVKRFHTEAEAAAKLEHPHIVPIYEIGEYDGTYYFSMAYVEGRSLAAIIRESPLPSRRAAEYLKKVADAMAYAHTRGVLHRDIKPGNILIDEHGEPHITDFGLAKHVGGDSELTHSGQILGTPTYMPPEQAKGDHARIGPQSDVYSLGATLYATLTGRPPFQAESSALTLLQVVYDPPIPPRVLNPSVSADVDTICLKCLEKLPGKRYESASALADDLQRYLADRPIVARPVGRPERAWRCCRRNPVVAALTAAVAVAMLAGTMVSAFFAIQAEKRAIAEANARSQETTARRASEKSRSEAETASVKAKAEARRAYRNYYISQMNLAQRDWDLADIDMLAERLNKTRPEQTGGEDLRGFEWYYWDRLCHARLFTRRLVLGDLSVAAFSPDGQKVAGMGQWAGRRIWGIWGVSTGNALLALKDPGGDFQGITRGHIVFASDGKRIAFSGDTHENVAVARVWDATTGEELLTLTDPDRGSLTRITFSPDGQRIATANAGDGTAQIWDPTSGQELLTLSASSDAHCQAVEFSPDLTRIATVYVDGMVKIWDADSGQELLSWDSKGDPFEMTGTLAFNPTGQQIATIGGIDGHTVRLWDAATGEPLPPSMKAPPSTVDYLIGERTVAFSRDGKRIAAAGFDLNPVYGWDVTRGKLWDDNKANLAFTLKGNSADVVALAFSPDGQRITTASSDATVRGWNVRTAEQCLTLRESDGGYSNANFDTIAFAPNGKQIAAVRENGRQVATRLWDATTGQELFTFKDARYVAFSPDGRIVTTYADGTAKLWDATRGQELSALKALAKEGEWQRSLDGMVVFSPDGQSIAVACGANGRLLDGTTGQELFSWKQPEGVLCVAFSANGTRMATGGVGSPRVSDVATRRGLLALECPDGQVYRIAFSPDGKRVAAAIAGQMGWIVKIWDSILGQELVTFKGQRAVTFSPDGKRIATVDATCRSVMVWDAFTGEQVLILNVDGVTNVAFSSDSNRLATTAGKSVQIWDATPVEPQDAATLAQPDRLVASTSPGVANPENETLVGPSPVTREREAEELWKLGGRFLDRGHRPSWSPDGTKTAIGKSGGGDYGAGGIAVLDMNTGERTDLTDSGKDPAWSGKDGRRIAYVTGSDEGEEIWVIEPSGKNKRRIAAGGFPSWSADGKTVFFSSRPADKLMAMTLDGEESLSPPKELETVPYSYPAVSSKGTRAAYPEEGQLVVVGLGSGNATQRFLLPDGAGFLGGWSPDGKQLGFGGFGGGDPMPCLILNVETGRAVQVASRFLTLPAWSPDGSRIAFDLRLSTGSEVWMIDAAALKDLKPIELRRLSTSLSKGGQERP